MPTPGHPSEQTINSFSPYTTFVFAPLKKATIEAEIGISNEFSIKK